MLLQGKNAVVTGARTGIGKAIVKRFLQDGANVWAVLHREDPEWLAEMQEFARSQAACQVVVSAASPTTNPATDRTAAGQATSQAACQVVVSAASPTANPTTNPAADQTANQTTDPELAKPGLWIKPVIIDLSDEAAIAAGVKQIISEKIPIDILVNAAGIVSPNRLIQMTPLSEMHRVMQLNFFAAVQLSQLMSRVMCRQKSGAIVNIASVAGIDGDFSQLEYASSKAALICATKKMAYEWGPMGIRVNAIAPGPTDTGMIGGMDDKVMSEVMARNTMNRMGRPEEVANLCAFLASDEASYITAQTIRIDGGGTNFVSTVR